MRSVLFAGLLASSAALAWPVDVYVDVKVGEEQFQKAAGTQWVDVEVPAVAVVEVLPGEELLLTGKQNGLSKLMLYGAGRMGVWRVSVCHEDSVQRAGELWRVRSCPAQAKVEPGSLRYWAAEELDARLSAATKSCPGLRTSPASASDKLVVQVKSDACRKALLELFRTDAFHSREVTLTFDIAVLQQQLRELQRAIDEAVGAKKVESLYAGGSLRLKGSITTAEHRKVLWAVFDNAVGRVTLDDRLVLTDTPAADAGTAAPAK